MQAQFLAFSLSKIGACIGKGSVGEALPPLRDPSMGDPLNGIVFVMNPASASGHTGKQWKKLAKRIAEMAGKEVQDIRVLKSERPLHATVLTRNALKVLIPVYTWLRICRHDDPKMHVTHNCGAPRRLVSGV